MVGVPCCQLVVSVLVENGAQVDLQDKRGLSALMLASQNGHAGVVEMLLKNGCRENLQNINGESAITIASEKNHAAVVKVLKENEAQMSLLIQGELYFGM